MSIDDVAKLLNAADSGWAVRALFVIGLYVLVWKYGGEVLRLSRDSNKKAGKASDTAQEIKREMETNHGSENIGDAMDRLTGWVSKIYKEQKRTQQLSRESSQEVHRLRTLVLDHLLDAPTPTPASKDDSEQDGDECPR